MAPVFQLVYRSLQTDAFDESRLKQLLLRARMRNAKSGITGLLLFHEGIFTQCLEGDKTAVMGLYERISVDNRHRDVATHMACFVGQRAFPAWSMACTGVESSEALALEKAHWNSRLDNEDPAQRTAPGIILMEAIWNVHQRSTKAG